MTTTTILWPAHGRKWINGKRVWNISRAFDVAPVGVDRVATRSETWLWYYLETPHRAVREGVSP